MNGPVICGIEETGDARAAGVARELSERYRLPLLLVHVRDDTPDEAEVARLLRETGVPATAELAVERGHPADRLVELAGEREASFLVLGNHGPRSSRLGSVSADVSRRAPCPVVVVPPTAGALLAAGDPAVDGGIVRFGLGRPVRRVA